MMKDVLITGANGFLGKRLTAELAKNCSNLKNIHTFRSAQYDLRDKQAIKALLQDKPVDTIIHLAASVGGIGANLKNPGKFFYDNLIMGVELIEQARLFGIQKFVAIGTICSYPKFTAVPFKEEDFWVGYPEETNAPYGLAKKMISVQIQAYRQQYGFNGITLLPVNMYGPGDNFDLESSHVIPAMIRKVYEARERGDNSVTFWGDGTPTREFMYVEDAARGIRLAAENYNKSEPINLGSGREIRMLELGKMIKNIVGFAGEIIWDQSKPNGQPRRCLDVSKAEKEFGFVSQVPLELGLSQTYEWYLENKDAISAKDNSTKERTFSKNDFSFNKAVFPK